jgi:hypothetical protein
MNKEDRKQENYIVGKAANYPKEHLKEWSRIDNDRANSWKKIEGNRWAQSNDLIISISCIKNYEN